MVYKRPFLPPQMIKIKINGRRITGKRAHYSDINHIVNASFVNKPTIKADLLKIDI